MRFVIETAGTAVTGMLRLPKLGLQDTAAPGIARV